MYSFKHIDTTTPYTIDNIMASRSGAELRYSNRFLKFAGTTTQALNNIDNAGRVTEDLNTSEGIIEGQKENINKLFFVAEEVIAKINMFQTQSGETQINNIPLPTEGVRAGYGKKMGYIKLALEFVSAGLEHFMEETLLLAEALKDRDMVIARIAHQHREIEPVGQLSEVTPEDLVSGEPIDLGRYESSQPEPVMTPPTTPDVAKTAKGKKALKK